MSRLRLVFDIEGDGFIYPGTVIWCIVAKDIDSGEIYKFGPEEIKDGVKLLQSADILVGHNIAGFDIPYIEKITGIKLDLKKCRDTLCMSKLFFPDKNRHSLDHYGKMFKRYKPEHEDWTQFSEDMLHRCSEDVEINHKLFSWLCKKEYDKWDWEKSLLTEQFFAYEQALQELAGVDIDVCLAKEILESINQEMEEIDKRLSRDMPPRIINKKPVNRPFKKDGDYSAMVYDWFCDDQNIFTVEAPFSRISYEEINLDSVPQVKKFLVSQGWIPTEWNYKKDEKGFYVKDEKGNKIITSSKLTEDSYSSIKGDLGKLVARRNVIKHRRSFIGWVNKKGEYKGILSHVRDDGKVPATGILCNAVTGRTTHSNAVCNVPSAKVKVPYGIPIRSVYCVPQTGYIMLGADLDQIEARITAHWASLFDNGDYWRVLQDSGDIHQFNADMLGVDRDPTAKAFQYAVFYGARAPKVASIIGCSEKKGQEYLDMFWDNTIGVYKLIRSLESYHGEHKFIEGLDGRKLDIRAKYKLLNTLIQSSATIVFKMWGIMANLRLRKYGVDCQQIIAYHDEYEYRCLVAHQERAEAIIKKAAIDAGKYYNLYTPITADLKSGRTWAEVH